MSYRNIVMVFPIPTSILYRQVVHVIDLLLPENCVHLLGNVHIRLNMLGIFTLKDVARPNFMAARTQFFCEIGADKVPTPDD